MKFTIFTKISITESFFVSNTFVSEGRVEEHHYVIAFPVYGSDPVS